MISAITSLRCTEDDPENYLDLLEKQHRTNIHQRIDLLSNSLRVSEEITPKIYKVILKVQNDLNLNQIELECYINNAPEMNAYCFSFDENINIILVITSALINSMSENELAFVIGHEVGHYVLGHLDYIKTHHENDKLLQMKLSRMSQLQEISADRIGLICSNSVEHALKAIIKTVSGLNNDFITDNLHTYLHQVKSLNYDEMQRLNIYTHPIFPIRAKALTLFSMSELYYAWKNNKKQAPISREVLEKKIVNDLEATTLKNEKITSLEIAEKFELWFYVKAFSDDGIINEDETRFLIQMFGEETANKAILYSNNNPDGISAKYLEFKEKMNSLSITHIKHILTYMEKTINASFHEHKIQKYFTNIKNSFSM